jgi:hypothetical protein
MLLFGEIVVEIAMIAAVIVAVACLAHLLQLSIREQLYLRRQRSERTAEAWGQLSTPAPRRTAPRTVPVQRSSTMLREKHV